MAKLTEQQKAQNKEATKLRDRAFRDRKNAYHEELEAAKASEPIAALVKATEDATSALDEMRIERANALGALQAEIAAIQRKMAEVTKEYDAKLDPLSQARKDAWDARNKAEAEAEAAIKAKYEDVAHCWSAAAWKPFEEFMPQAADK